MILIDTILLCGNSEQKDVPDELHGNELRGPTDRAAADKQLEWLDETLASGADAPYAIVGGHYPVYSICEHGPTSCLIKEVLPILRKHRVTAYFNGHDHCAEHISGTSNADPEFHTIGSAHENNPSTDHLHTLQKGQLQWHTGKGKGGFGAVTVDADGLTVTHFDGDGKELYKAPKLKPRTNTL